MHTFIHKPVQRWVRVAVDRPLRRLFDYQVPPELVERIGPGRRVRVPFGRSELVGLVVDGPHDQAPEGFEARPLAALLDDGPEPLVPAELIELCRWAADYYQHPPGEVFAAALPAPLRDGAALPSLGVAGCAATEAGLAARGTLPARATAMRGLLDALLEGPCPRSGLAASAATLAKAMAAGWIKPRELPPPAPPSAAIEPHPEPTAEQASVLAAFPPTAGDHSACLLEGVTGSGKTEVYLRLAERELVAGRQVLVLAPEIGLTPQLAQRFAQRFGDAAVVRYHSALADGERSRAWRAARDGVAAIVVGTRSAIFLPLARPGLLIVDEEHDASYKQPESLRYSARDLAVLRARRLGIPVLLGSATPSLESLHNAQAGRYQHLQLVSRAHGAAPPPRIGLLDVRHRVLDHGLSEPMLDAVAQHLAAGRQALLFLNRRGYAPVLLCHDCGYALPCPDCDARLVVHRARRRLACHHCGITLPMPETCADCGGSALVPVGAGTERIEDALRLRFPAARIERFDSDRLSSPARAAELFEAVRRGEIDLLVGTQVLAKGHDFPRLGFAGLVDVDQALFGSDFRALERMGQLVTQVAGRVGRAGAPGEVLLQTHQPEHPLLKQLVEHGYPSFASRLLTERREFSLPPFAALALLRAEARSEGEALAFLRSARTAMPAATGVEALGPAPATMARRAGYYRAQLLLRSPSRAGLHRLIAQWLPQLEALAAARRLRWSLDIDPQDLH